MKVTRQIERTLIRIVPGIPWNKVQVVAKPSEFYGISSSIEAKVDAALRTKVWLILEDDVVVDVVKSENP